MALEAWPLSAGLLRWIVTSPLKLSSVLPWRSLSLSLSLSGEREGDGNGMARLSQEVFPGLLQKSSMIIGP